MRLVRVRCHQLAAERFVERWEGQKWNMWRAVSDIQIFYIHYIIDLWSVHVSVCVSVC